jgi:hypothetical protein
MNRDTRRRATITDLRRAIDDLPRATRVAMLEGIRRNDIIVGAYTGPEGICPMLAAHRAGQRTSFNSFAEAWDMFALGGARDRTARRATRRELLVLTAHLETSLLEDETPMPGLSDAIAEHRRLAGRRARSRIVRRYDDYERAPASLQRERERERVAEPPRDRPLATPDRR